MTIKKVVFIAVLCAFAFVATPVMADTFGHGAGYDGGTAYYSRTDGYGNTYGGEFTIEKGEGPGLLLSNSAYVVDVTSGITDTGSFQSFCVEWHESMDEPVRIWVSEEAAGIESEDNGPGSHAWKGGTYLGDDLDPMTAYLYTMFATGSLDNYDYTPNTLGGTRIQSAAALQNVIWGIEGESGLSWSPSEPLETAFWTAANNAVNIAQTWDGIGNVRVLQTYSEDYYCRKQDQLYLTPIPGAAVLGILGLCVAGVKLRKFA